MRVASDQLSQHLSRKLAPLYTVFGEDLLLAIEASDLIRAKAREAGYAEREIFSIDHHFNWAELQQRSSSLSLFAERRIMDMRIPSGKPGVKGSVAIEEYCRALPADTVTLVMLPKIDKQSSGAKWFKALEAAGVVVPVYPVERAHLPAWIGRRLATQGQSADPDTLRFIAEKVEGNLLAAAQELKKLTLLYPTGMLSFGQVKDAVLDVARYDVFKLSEAMLSGDTTRYVRILEELRGEGTVLPYIVSTLAAQIRSLVVIRRGLDAGRRLPEVMSQVRARQDQQKALESAARRISAVQLTGALLQLSKIDRISKGVGHGDAWDELLQLALRFAVPATRRK
jgi:DNA polymerase III subunit delta